MIRLVFLRKWDWSCVKTLPLFFRNSKSLMLTFDSQYTRKMLTLYYMSLVGKIYQFFLLSALQDCRSLNMVVRQRISGSSSLKKYNEYIYWIYLEKIKKSPEYEQ